MKTAVRWTVLVVAVLGVIGAIAFALVPAPVPVQTAPASVAPMRVTIDEEGKTRIRERYVVSSPLAGRLGRVTLDPGDRVTADETVLAVIEPTDPELLDARELAEAQARVRAAEAAVAQAEATADSARTAEALAETTLTRVEEMFARNAANEYELVKARSDHRATSENTRAAGQAVEIARYELELARSALLYTTGEQDPDLSTRFRVRSPITGAVLRVFQESAAVIAPGAPLLELGDPLDLEIVVDVLSTDAVRAKPGDRVIIERWGGDDPLEGVVRLVEPSAFTKISALGIEEQRVNVIVDLVSPPDDRPTLGDAFRVEARIVTWESPGVLQVPSSAVFRGADAGWSVFVVESDRAHRRNVEIGERTPDAAQITGGLAEGEEVILHPGDRVAEGRRVELNAQ